MVTRRQMVLAGGIAGVLGTVPSGCGPVERGREQAAPTVTAPPVTIEHYNYLDPAQLERMKPVWAKFQDAFPHIKVQHLQAEGNEANKREKMQTLVAGGTPPAVLGQIIAQYPSYYVLPGLVEPIDALMSADKVDRKFYSATTVDTFRYKGAQYALPYGASMELIAYNKELFDKQGVKPPPKVWDDPTWTLNEFITRAQTLTKAPEGGTAEQFGWSRSGPFWVVGAVPWGTDWVSEDLTKFQSTNQPVIDALQFRQDVTWRQHISPQPQDNAIFGNLSSSQRFLSGKIAMADLGSWYLPAWIKNATFAWDVAPYFKAGSGTASGAIYPVGEAIGKGTKNRQQAWQLVKFLTVNPNANLEYAFLKGAAPALMVNNAPWRTLLSKEMPGITVQIPADAVGKFGKVARLHFAAKFDEITKLIGPIVSDVEANKTAAKTALEQVAPQVQQLLGS